MVRFLLFCLTLCATLAAQLPIRVDAKAAILMNADTGAILYEKNAHEPLYPASITKVATALELLTHYPHKLSDTVVADRDSLGWVTEEARRRNPNRLAPYWLETGAVHAGIAAGEELSMRDLFGLMLVGSANDAANVIARHLGGTIPDFMARLNQHLKELGCHNTHFVNPHGLHRNEHKSCAYDLATITRAAWAHPLFRELTKSTYYPRPVTNKTATASAMAQTNRLICPGTYFYPKALGGKTGYHLESGHCLMAIAHDPDQKRTLIGVLLGCESREVRFREMVRLMEMAFQEQPITLALLPPGPQKWTASIPGGNKTLATYTDTPSTLTYYPSEKPQFQAFLHWAPLTLPIAKGSQVGEIRFQSPNGTVLATAPLKATDNIDPTLLYSVKVWLVGHPIGLGIGGLTAVVIGIWVARRRRNIT